MFTEKITFLSGGTGTPKLILGFRQLIHDEQIIVIGNSGDDEEFFGLLVSPDIDTLIYLFSNQLDLEKFWGIKKDSFTTLKQLELMKEEIWFQLGDKDFALHLLRNKLKLAGYSICDIVQEICQRLDIKAKIIPMSNRPLRTKMITKEGRVLTFQEYTVKNSEKDRIKKICYLGTKKAKASEEALKAILSSSLVIIGPSNPLTSIGPMLALKRFKKALCKTSAKIIAISPIYSGKTFSGPAANLMKDLNMEASPLGIAKLYKDFLNTIIIANEDESLKKPIEDLGIEVICGDISLNTQQEKEALAKLILKNAIKKSI